MTTIKTLLITILVFLSFGVKGQVIINKNYADSILILQKSYIGKVFKFNTCRDLEGNSFSDSNLKGKVTLINFWFESCPPCVAEFNALNKIFASFKNNTNFNFISFTFEDSIAAKKYVEQYHLTFHVIPITEKLCYQYNFNSGFPTSMIIDKAGKICYFKLGGAPDAAKAEKDIDSTILASLEKLLIKENSY